MIKIENRFKQKYRYFQYHHMKKQANKWIWRCIVTALFMAALLTVIILNPALTYANKTVHGNYTIFHNQPFDQAFLLHLDEATMLVSKSEYYNYRLKLDICLNDGSIYPAGIQQIFGRAFGTGFYNKVVLGGNLHYTKNYAEINGYKWNLTQLLAHEMIHCFQFNKRGLRKSNPLAGIPHWKWEGYPEYVARQHADQKDLVENIHRLALAEQTDNNGWIQFPDSSGAVISYYKIWLLLQYCKDIKKMTYDQIIDDTTRQEAVRQQMMNWYEKRK